MQEKKEYLEVYDYGWDFTPEQIKIMEDKWDYISQLIPSDVKSIIDIGCGNGFFTDRFFQKYETIGVDINENNLKKIRAKTIRAFAHEIDLPDESIDLVFSSELLEHLPDESILQKTIEKFKQLTKKYILITVPNRQNLKSAMVKCGNCGYIFNSAFHNFSFNKKKLSQLFNEFRIIHFNTIGPLYRPFTNNLLIYIKNNIANNWAIPNEYTKCPNCNRNDNFIHQKNLVSKACYATNYIITRKRRAWIVILFEKK